MLNYNYFSGPSDLNFKSRKIQMRLDKVDRQRYRQAQEKRLFCTKMMNDQTWDNGIARFSIVLANTFDDMIWQKG